jgi:hypothetical protein
LKSINCSFRRNNRIFDSDIECFRRSNGSRGGYKRSEGGERENLKKSNGASGKSDKAYLGVIRKEHVSKYI